MMLGELLRWCILGVKLGLMNIGRCWVTIGKWDCMEGTKMYLVTRDLLSLATKMSKDLSFQPVFILWIIFVRLWVQTIVKIAIIIRILYIMTYGFDRGKLTLKHTRHIKNPRNCINHWYHKWYFEPKDLIPLTYVHTSLQLHLRQHQHLGNPCRI